MFRCAVRLRLRCWAMRHKVRFVGATSADRLTLLQSGQIDLLVRDTTQTFVRNNSHASGGARR